MKVCTAPISLLIQFEFVDTLILFLFTDMLNEAKQTSSTPDRYLIAARNVYSALDYAINRSEKMVAYPDLINAAGPDFREHLYSPMTLCDQTMVPPIDKHEDCKLESGMDCYLVGLL